MACATGGHANVPRRAKDDPELGTSLTQTRIRIRRGEYPKTRVAQLEALGIWARRPSVWDRRIAELRAYKAEHGHAHPQVTSSLGAWLAMQRKKFRQGTLTKEQVRTLKELGFHEKTRRRFPENPSWKPRLEGLEAFRKKHGHCLVPVSHPKLGWFVGHVRGLKVKGQLPQDVFDRPEALGFAWAAYDERFERGMAELADFKARHGHVLGPFAIHLPFLSRWVTKQRRYKRKGKLADERVKRVEAMGFEWEGFRGRSRQDVEVELLADFRRRHGHLAIPDEAPHRALFAWAREQRGLYGTGKLNTRLKGELLELEFPFTRTELEWERRYASARSVHERYGDLRRASGELAQWLDQQRRAQLAGKLTLAQEDRLLKLEVF